MLLKTLLLLHVCSATVGLLSGFLAMVLRKGSGFHGAAGAVFFVSMISASGAGATIAAFAKPNNANLMGSALTFYLVATAWVSARRRNGKWGFFDLGALLTAFAIAAAGAAWGFAAASSRNGLNDGYPPAFYFVFAFVAALLGVSDVRMIVRGGLFGAKRIARHLWRMGLALLFALLSFLPRLPKLYPGWFRSTSLLLAPSFLLLGVLLFWLYRLAARRRSQDQSDEHKPSPRPRGEIDWGYRATASEWFPGKRAGWFSRP